MKSLLVVLAAAFLITLAVVSYRHSMRALPAPSEPVVSLVLKTKSPQLNKRFADLPPGATISGPLKNRKLAFVVLPEYPDWAERDGITAQMSAKICVRPDGNVSSLIQMTRMSTEQRLDVLAVDALRQWRFAKAPSTAGDQWGIVTFHFKLLYSRPFGALTVKVTGSKLKVS